MNIAVVGSPRGSSPREPSNSTFMRFRRGNVPTDLMDAVTPLEAGGSGGIMLVARTAIEGSALSGEFASFSTREGMMSRSHTFVVSWGLLQAVLCGCGKSQPAGGNQVAAAPNTQVITGTVTYQTEGQPGQTPPPGAPGMPGAAVPPPTAGSPVGGPTVGTPTAPIAGVPANAPAVGPTVSSPTVGTPNATPGGPGQVQPPAVTGSQSMPAAASQNTRPGTAATPSTSALAPGANPAAPQANASGQPAQSNAVPSGDFSALAAAVNQWRAQGANLAGVKRLDDKPVLAGYSWMTQLLPYLGHNELYGHFDFTKGWHDQANIALACQEIPAFLDPTNPNRHMTIVGVKEAIGPAFTHYVGMAGVEDARNLVAAELPRTDPRAGIFGYDQVATNDQITDGTSNTIMLIGAGKIVGPWISGGGATVRGARAPYFDDITGFGSAGDPGAGALVSMADGSVKRISKDIDPAVFRALSTIHGAESIDLKANANVIRAP